MSQAHVCVRKLLGSSTANKPAVLVIGDEEAIRELLTKVLNENGYTTDSCGTRLEAIRKASLRRGKSS
jgi:CheY-like chemotaxis protein